MPGDTIIKDFYIRYRIAQRGYRVAYAPEAYVSESHSASIGEEWKRKVRIAAGGLQAIARLNALLKPWRNGLLSFQYISHRVLRWTLAPLFLPLIFAANWFLARRGSALYRVLFGAQQPFMVWQRVDWRPIELAFACSSCYIFRSTSA